jgi:predicted acyl esterase
MHLWMAANVPDADIVARLDDVAPDGGVQSFNMHGQFRASGRALATAPYDNLGLPWHRHHAADAAPLVSDQPAEIAFEMLPLSYIFKAGHSVRLTLFFADPVAPAAPDARASISVLLGADRASFVTLPIITASGARPRP